MAIDPNKKFLYFNKDGTSGEMDDALCFPVSSFIGAETQAASFLDVYFKGSKGTDATQVRFTIDTAFINIKNFYKKLVDQINFGEIAFIKVNDYAERTTNQSDVTFAISADVQPIFTLQDTDFIVAGDNLTFDSVQLTGIQTSAESFVNDDVSLMTSAAIEDKILSYGYSTASGDITGVSISVGTGLDISQSNTASGNYSATVSLDLTEVGVSGSANQILTDDGDGTVTSESDVTYDAGAFSITSATGGKPSINLTATGTAPSKSANLNFIKDAADTEDNELLGVIAFMGEDEGNNNTTFANIQAAITESDETDEAGQLTIQVATSDGTTSTSRNALFATGSASADDVDVTLGHGSTSTTTVPGKLVVGTRIDFDSAGITAIQTASESFADNDTSLMTSAAIDDRINAAGGGVSVSDSTANTDFPVVFHDESNNLHDDTAAFTYNPSTGNAVIPKIQTAGNIELGHASDTTVARLASGIVTVEGEEVVTTLTRSLSSGGVGVPLALMQARRTLTEAELNNLNLTPITIVAAQGANTVIMPMEAVLFVDRDASTAQSTSASLLFSWDGNNNFQTDALLYARRFMFNESGDRILNMKNGYTGEVGTSLTAGTNKPVKVVFDAAITSGSLDSMDVYLTYYVLNIS